MRALRRGCLILGVLASGQAWADACEVKQYGTLPVAMIDGRATSVVKINGADTRMIVDSGAFFSTLSNAHADALKLKTRPAPYDLSITGVGGITSARVATVKQFGMLDTTLSNVDFIVGGTDMGYGLLGANLLDLADVEYDLAGGKVILAKVSHCDNAQLAYWVKDGGEYNVIDLPWSRNRIGQSTYFNVTINGKRVRALLDSGAGVTVLTRKAAERAGIDLDAPEVEQGHRTYGIGSKTVKSWIVRVDSFEIGTEKIQHTRMQVIDGTFGDSETGMLLGVDFLLAHRMFIDNTDGKAYFTYNGGRVFSLAAVPIGRDKADADLSASDDGAAPKTAADYALLGQSRLARGETAAAIADLDEAIRLAPDQAAYYAARARAQLGAKQADAALADLDQSITLDPGSTDALLLRAKLRLALGNREGAQADVIAASALTPAGSQQAHTVATLYLALDEPAAALPVLDDWIRLHANDAQLGLALNERCWARAITHQMLDDALKDCRKAIRRDGELAPYLDSLGMAQLRLGQYADAVEAYDQAIAKNDKSAWSFYGRGLAKIRLGQVDAGNADLTAARALDPQIEEMAQRYGLVGGGK